MSSLFKCLVGGTYVLWYEYAVDCWNKIVFTRRNGEPEMNDYAHVQSQGEHFRLPFLRKFPTNVVCGFDL